MGRITYQLNGLPARGDMPRLRVTACARALDLGRLSNLNLPAPGPQADRSGTTAS